jgi:hypothetical protein
LSTPRLIRAAPSRSKRGDRLRSIGDQSALLDLSHRTTRHVGRLGFPLATVGKTAREIEQTNSHVLRGGRHDAHEAQILSISGLVLALSLPSWAQVQTLPNTHRDHQRHRGNHRSRQASRERQDVPTVSSKRSTFPPARQRFNEVKVGDKVSINNITQRLSEIEAAGEPTSIREARRPQQGSRRDPGATVAVEKTMTATITAIDKKRIVGSFAAPTVGSTPARRRSRAWSTRSRLATMVGPHLEHGRHGHGAVTPRRAGERAAQIRIGRASPCGVTDPRFIDKRRTRVHVRKNLNAHDDGSTVCFLDFRAQTPVRKRLRPSLLS